jgi:inorganic pyrophosphatase
MHSVAGFSMNNDFWEALGGLVKESEIVVDRPKGSSHPRFLEYIYPYDYGYLKDTISADGEGIDVWQVGDSKDVTGIIVTVDRLKKDSEIKILLGTTEKEANEILQFHKRGDMQALLVSRE